MSPVWGPIAGGFILAMMVTFIAIWAWAWSPAHARTFEALSRLPMEERDVPGGADGEQR